MSQPAAAGDGASQPTITTAANAHAIRLPAIAPPSAPGAVTTLPVIGRRGRRAVPRDRRAGVRLPGAAVTTGRPGTLPLSGATVTVAQATRPEVLPGVSNEQRSHDPPRLR